MCIIAVCRKRLLTPEEFNNCWDNNPHGGGIAWFEGKLLRFKKGFMDKEDFKDFYYSHIVKHEHVIHFRIRSSGAITPQLTHPFVVADRFHQETEGVANTLLFHNGTNDYDKLIPTLSAFKTIDIPSDYSDSSATAVLLHYMGDSILRAGGSYVVMKAGGEIKIYGKHWTGEGGCLFSNQSYRR